MTVYYWHGLAIGAAVGFLAGLWLPVLAKAWKARGGAGNRKAPTGGASPATTPPALFMLTADDDWTTWISGSPGVPWHGVAEELHEYRPRPRIEHRAHSPVSPATIEQLTERVP